MTRVGATEAAKLTGKSRVTIQRAMKSGKISCEKDENGHRVVDVSELERVFGLKQQAALHSATDDATRSAENPLDNSAVKQVLEAKEEVIDQLRKELEKTEAEKNRIWGLLEDRRTDKQDAMEKANQAIEALRAQLEATTNEKNKAVKAANGWKAEAQKSFWQRLFG